MPDTDTASARRAQPRGHGVARGGCAGRLLARSGAAISSNASQSPPPVHGGDVVRAAIEAGRDPASTLDFSANIHPLGAPPGFLDAARGAISDVHRYPSPSGEPLRSRISERVGAEVVAWPAEVRHGDRAEPGDALVIGRPNNPDGHMPSVDDVAAMRRAGVRVVVDESFLGFTHQPSCVGLDGVIVVTSMTKTFGIPGLRLGWASGIDPRLIPTWTVNGPALAAGLACLDSWNWPRQVALDVWRADLTAALLVNPRVAAVEGAANFLLVTLREAEGPALRHRALREHGVLIRDASNFAGRDEHHIRVAVRTPAENARLVEALR